MKRILLGVVATVVLSAAAFAADLPARTYTKTPAIVASPVYNWTGCYIGGNVNVGGGWVRKSISSTLGDFTRATTSGAVGGGQFGCDYQWTNWVFGIQGMFDATSISGNNGDLIAAPGRLTWSTRNSWFGTLTGRIGYLVQPVMLIYAKGGGAWMRDHNFRVDNIFPTSASQTVPDTTLNGWTVGVGLEYMFTPNWSAFVEYDYAEFGTKTEPVTRISDGATFPVNVNSRLQTALVGVNYRFGWGSPVVAKY